MEEFKYEGLGWYMTRGGEKAWVGCNLYEGGYKGGNPLRGCIGSVECMWNERGEQPFDCTEDNLTGGKLPEPKRIKGWIALSGKGKTSWVSERKEIAKSALYYDGVVACIEIDVEEGEGL